MLYRLFFIASTFTGFAVATGSTGSLTFSNVTTTTTATTTTPSTVAPPTNVTTNHLFSRRHYYRSHKYNNVNRPSNIALILREPHVTLKQLYSSNSGNTNRRKTLLDIDFYNDFAEWNPRNNESQFRWQNGDPNDTTSVPADNAAIVLHTVSSSSASSAPYGQKQQQKGYAEFTSIPFSRAFSADDEVNSAYPEGVAEWKQTVVLNNFTRYLVEMLFTCNTVNTERYPFLFTLVTDPFDDLRLANCQLQVQTTSAIFSIDVTRKGVWAVYTDTVSFVAKRRIGYRHTYDDIVDAAIEIDPKQQVVNFYLNKYLTWTIRAVGLPPPNDGITKIDAGQAGVATMDFPRAFTVRFGTQKCLDESDPNAQDSRTRLVNLRGNSTFYGLTDVFYVPAEPFTPSALLWGQGASMHLYILKVTQTDASDTPALRVVLPSAYVKKKLPYL